MNLNTKQKLINHLNKWQVERDALNKELIASCDVLLKQVSDMQKKWAAKSVKSSCIADVDTPCDCPKCEAYALEMKKEYEAGNLDPFEDDEECPHSEHDHFICMDCGEDRTDYFVGMAETMSEGER